MTWNGLPDVDATREIGDVDADLLAELKDVLARHDALGRIGLVLLHSHFDLADNEVLVETVDRDQRTLMIRPVPREHLQGGTLVPTIFRLDLGRGAQPVQFCWRPRGSDIHAV